MEVSECQVPGKDLTASQHSMLALAAGNPQVCPRPLPYAAQAWFVCWGSGVTYDERLSPMFWDKAGFHMLDK